MAPAVENAVTRLNAAWVAAGNAARSADLEHLIAPDHTVVSHRFGGLVPASEGVDQMRTLSRAGDEVGFTAQTTQPIAVRGDRLALFRLTATTADGLISERLEVTELDEEGRFARTEIFEPDTLADALETLDCWYAAGDRPATRIRNTVTDVIDRYSAQCAAGEFGGERFGSVDFVRYDRRRGVSTPTLHGLAEFASNMRAIFEVFDTFTTEPVAIRGERVALVRVHLAREGFATTMLGVYETDEDGLLIRGTSFDEDDLDAALDELEARFIAGEGTDHEYLIRRARDFTRSLAQLDGAATLALLDPATEIVDHRPLGLGTFGLDGARAWNAARAEQVAEDVSFFRNLSVRGDAILGHLESRGVDDLGTAFLYEMYLVSHWVAGRARWTGQYSLDDHEAARARFDELAAETRSPYVDNDCVRSLVRAEWLAGAGDITAAVDTIASDVVAVDHRSGIGGLRIEGREAFVENQIAVREQLTPQHRWLAVRGERLALGRLTWTAANGFEAAHHATFEIDQTGRLCRNDQFDDLTVALDALDARYEELVGTELPPAEASLLEGVKALNRREWDRFTALFHPDLVAVDHSPLGFPTTDRDGFVNDQMRGMAELVPDVVVVVGKILTEGRASLVTGTTLGTTAEGNEYRWDFLQVFRAAEDGRGQHRDLYADTQWEEALARFDEFAAEDATTLPSTVGGPENGLTRRLRAAVVRLQGRDEADGVVFPPDAEIGAAFLIADDIVILDRRSGVSAGTITGSADFLANASAHFAVFAEARPTVLAVRGERLALVRMDFEADGFVSTRINIFEADASGALAAIVVFDDDALAAAFEELEARHAAIESAGENRATIAGRRSIDAFVRGDRDAALEAFSPGFTRSDRRRGPTIGDVVSREQYVDATLAGAEVGMAHFDLTPLELAGDDRATRERSVAQRRRLRARVAPRDRGRRRRADPPGRELRRG